METYTIQEAEERFGELLQRVRAGHRVLLVDEIGDFAEIRPLKSTWRGDSEEDVLRELEADGVIIRPTEPRGALFDSAASDADDEGFRQLVAEGILVPPETEPERELAPIAFQPGALARFLASRD